jgi:uncharacterized protein (DUF2147 family)
MSLANVSLAGMPVIALTGILAVSDAYAGQAAADGEWARDDGVLRTHIAACGRDICAVNSWTKDPQGAEKVGDKLVMTLRETDRNHWTGLAFDPQRNLTYSMELTVAGDRMATRGCVLVGVLCRSVGWIRVKR